MRRIDKLSKSEQESLVFDLVYAFVTIGTVSEVALFLQDLFTKSEIRMLGKRLRIAKLLLSGMTYTEIQSVLHVSHSSVAKIAAWLNERGEGFRKTIQRLPMQPKTKAWEDYSDWDRIKRKYSIYFWPELLLEEIVKNANQKQKERIRNVLKTVEQKSELHKRIDKLLKSATT